MAEIVLTREQNAVINDRGGALLVSAAAGSGKTKVLIDRVMKKVACENANVDDFLMITFTQAAAAELRGKLIAQLSEKLSQDPSNHHLQNQMSRIYLAQISTIHAFCMTLLRDYAHELQLPADFRICDDQEGLALRRRAMLCCLDQAYREDKEDPEIRDALNMLGAGRNDAALEDLITDLYYNLQCYKDPRQRVRELYDSVRTGEETDAGKTLWGDYLIHEFRHLMEGVEAQFSLLLEKAREGGVDPYLPTLQDNIYTVRALRALHTWQELQQAVPDFGRLSTKKTDADPHLKETVRSQRTRLIKETRHRLKKFAQPSEEVLQDLRMNASAITGLIRLTERFSQLFANEKKRRHVLDYNDLEHEVLRLVCGKGTGPTRAAKEISQRYREIMVDEYQDSNAVQDALFYAISKNGENLFFVGDIKQSIYRFRMADPTIFRGKYIRFADYRQAVEHEPRKILLSDNFRSNPAVLEAANAVFHLTMTDRVGGLYYTDAEALRANQKVPDMGSPAVELHCVDASGIADHGRDEVEAEFIAHRVARMLREKEKIPGEEGLRPIRPGDIVLLFRALRGKAEVYLEALRRHGISAICTDNNIFESEEVTVLSALLQIIDNPHQDIPLLTVLLSPLFRFPTGKLAELRGKNKRADIYDLLSGADCAADFIRQLSELRDFAQEVSVRSLLDEIDTRLYLRSVFGSMDSGLQRIRNLERFYAIADTYESGDRVGLSGFLRYLELVKQRPSASEQPAGDAVRLMTIHASKGLEFPVVILADLSKRFNYADTSAKVITDPVLGIGADVYDKELRLRYPSLPKNAISDRIRRESLSEEMRVLYVAMTRAKYRMTLSCCAAGMKKKIVDLAGSLSIPVAPSVLESVGSMGDWILMTALTRTEAGELFALCDPPGLAKVSEYPWCIRFHEGADFLPTDALQQEVAEQEAAQQTVPYLCRNYAHTAAAAMPAKLTATQMKSETTADEAKRTELQFHKPSFGKQGKLLTGAQRGTAIHLAMQYLDYDRCGSEEGLRKELKRLQTKRFLSPEQVSAVSVDKLLRFFRSELFQRIQRAKKVVREFKFTLLEDASHFDSALEGEQILLQGVTDCCIIEEDGLTVLDFKSDSILPGQEPCRGEYYRGQLDAYSRALCRIFSMPVKERILYFFATDSAYRL